MSLKVTEPILVIGLGGVGSRLATQVKESLGIDCLLISNDLKDFPSGVSTIFVSTKSVVNPSMHLIRGAAYEIMEEIDHKISQYSSVILVANLAGKTGAAIAPLISNLCHQNDKTIISFAIMPFKFEKDRIFNSGISLKRLKDSSNCTIVLDNDALLDSNPDLTTKACHEISNMAILQVINSLKSSEISEEMNIISTSKEENNVEESLKSSMRMLYEDAPPNAIKRSILYILGGNKVPVGVLNSVTNIASGIFNNENTSVTTAIAASEQSKVVMLTSIHGQTHFDRYDPLGVIPKDNIIDWKDPECSINCNLDLYQLE